MASNVEMGNAGYELGGEMFKERCHVRNAVHRRVPEEHPKSMVPKKAFPEKISRCKYRSDIRAA